jgi:tetratricopeptide (TPR) repeat protein
MSLFRWRSTSVLDTLPDDSAEADPAEIGRAVEVVGRGKRRDGINRLVALLKRAPGDVRVVHALFLAHWFGLPRDAGDGARLAKETESTWRTIVGTWVVLRHSPAFWDWFWAQRRPHFPEAIDPTLEGVRDDVEQEVMQRVPEDLRDDLEAETEVARILSGAAAGVVPCGPLFMGLLDRDGKVLRAVTKQADSGEATLGLSASSWSWLALLLTPSTRKIALAVRSEDPERAMGALQTRPPAKAGVAALTTLASELVRHAERLDEGHLDQLVSVSRVWPDAASRVLRAGVADVLEAQAYEANQAKQYRKCISLLLRCRELDPGRISLQRNFSPAFGNVIGKLCKDGELDQAMEHFETMVEVVEDRSSIGKVGLRIVNDLLGAKRLTEAHRICRLTADHGPEDGEARTLVEALAESSSKGWTPVVQELRKKSLDCAKRKDWTGAIRHLDGAIKACAKRKGRRELEADLETCKSNESGRLQAEAAQQHNGGNVNRAIELLLDARAVEPKLEGRVRIDKNRAACLTNRAVQRVNDAQSSTTDGVSSFHRPDRSDIMVSLVHLCRALKRSREDLELARSLHPGNRNIEEQYSTVVRMLDELPCDSMP